MSIQPDAPPSGQPTKVLFFGRSGCHSTGQALSLLQTLGCDVEFVVSKGRGDVLPTDISNWHGDYILCFRSLFVLPQALLDRARIAAINFHPAPPEYPGSGCINFALFEEADSYGVTAHVMNDKVDNGAILECNRFPILPSDGVDTLLQRTHLKLLNLFFDVVSDLLLGKRSVQDMASASASEQWRGVARRMKDFEPLKQVPLDVAEDHLKRIIRATYTQHYPPFVRLFGYDFFLKSPEKSP
jgi:methionyl-tRNA formyltransferase